MLLLIAWHSDTHIILFHRIILTQTDRELNEKEEKIKRLRSINQENIKITDYQNRSIENLTLKIAELQTEAEISETRHKHVVEYLKQRIAKCKESIQKMYIESNQDNKETMNDENG